MTSRYSQQPFVASFNTSDLNITVIDNNERMFNHYNYVYDLITCPLILVDSGLICGLHFNATVDWKAKYDVMSTTMPERQSYTSYKALNSQKNTFHLCTCFDGQAMRVQFKRPNWYIGIKHLIAPDWKQPIYIDEIYVER